MGARGSLALSFDLGTYSSCCVTPPSPNEGFVWSLAVSCLAVFSGCSWETCSFLEVGRGGLDLRERGHGGK